MPFNKTITQATCYKYTNTDTGKGANITIEAYPEGGGCLSIHSFDYGTYSHIWGSGIGDKTFRAFLISLAPDYIEDKLHVKSEFDHPGTISDWQTQIETALRDNEIDQITYGRVINELNSLKTVNALPVFIFEIQNRCPNILSFFDGIPQVFHIKNAKFQEFLRDIWPLLIKQLKTEEVINKTHPVEMYR